MEEMKIRRVQLELDEEETRQLEEVRRLMAEDIGASRPLSRALAIRLLIGQQWSRYHSPNQESAHERAKPRSSQGAEGRAADEA